MENYPYDLLPQSQALVSMNGVARTFVGATHPTPKGVIPKGVILSGPKDLRAMGRPYARGTPDDTLSNGPVFDWTRRSPHTYVWIN